MLVAEALDEDREEVAERTSMTDEERRSLMDGWHRAVRAVQVFSGAGDAT